MRVFDLKGAKHFGSGAGALGAYVPTSFREYVSTALRAGETLSEGSDSYQEYRGHALREVDRLLFMAISNYRRSLDLLTTSSAYWSWVTAYYSSYYSATAIMGLLGVTIVPHRVLVDVAANAPGNQRLRIERCPKDGPTLEDGSRSPHKLFWDFYYDGVSYIRADLPDRLMGAVEPIDDNRAWQINTRNTQNYDTFEALKTCEEFGRRFHASSFPMCLWGDFETQMRTSTTMIDLGLWLATEVGLKTDAISTIGRSGSWRQKAEELIRRAESPFGPSRPLFKVKVQALAVNY